ncbi:GntR family transcriptional regulator [Cohnella cholangitidis]|uniref:GntR family transcriptional regulator n=1 Tax=Cohnella cholangitidis TaxID=2598458 RepID=A0A7G5BSS7_9BACL|nr:GntR family transcriptional regulator [Cohnella cholangitidis]QMV40011.1 GntR family transcriptional regulator [Cohnella cholangitidis]
MTDKQMLLPISSISESVYAALKKDIIDGTLHPGHRLIVLEIAGKYQISQAPVREALERLKQEGLIVGQPNKGSVVSSITSKEIKDLFVLREIIESFAVKQSISLLTDQDYINLEQILTEMEAAIQINDSLAILEKDMEFHGYFFTLCDNGAILELWHRMRTTIMRFMAISNRHYSTEKLAEWHLQLIAALKTGDARLAENKFIEHMHAYKMIDLN